MIRLGYVGLNTTLPKPNKIFRLSNYSEEKMLETTRANLQALQTILAWNKEQHIVLFRLSSQLVPLGSHPINNGSWKKLLTEDFAKIGQFIRDNSMKVSMHPGQYTVLNAQNETYYKNALADLAYHATIFELMGLDHKHRMVIHGGGAYGNKEASLAVLKERINVLPENIYSRFMLENDDVTFTADEILQVCLETGVPGVLDTFHHEVLPGANSLSVRELLLQYKKSWPKDEVQKIQYSNQDLSKSKGAHSQHTDIAEFENFYETVKDLDFDIMLEVKDKEQSLLDLRKHFPALH